MLLASIVQDGGSVIRWHRGVLEFGAFFQYSRDMKIQVLVAVCSASLTLTACGKDKAQQETPVSTSAPVPVPEPATGTKVVEKDSTKVAVAGDVKPDDSAVAGIEAECQTLLDNSWKAVQPALALTKIDPSTVEKNYVKNKYFINNCVALKPDARACLTKSESPLTALADCNTNETVEKGKSIHLSTIFSMPIKGEVIPEEEQAKRLAAVVGTWKNEFKSYGQVKTWKIGKAGEVTETSKRNGKDEEPREYTIQFEYPAHVKLSSGPSSAQYYGYLQVDAKTMFVNSNLSYGAYPAEDDHDFILLNRSERIVFKDDKCNAVTDEGVILDATCTWGKAGKVRTFNVEYQLPGRKKRDGSVLPTTYTYHYIAKHLVDDRQVGIAKFVKK